MIKLSLTPKASDSLSYRNDLESVLDTEWQQWKSTQMFLVFRKQQQTDERKKEVLLSVNEGLRCRNLISALQKKKTPKKNPTTTMFDVLENTKRPNLQNLQNLRWICPRETFWVWKIRRITGALWADFKTLIAVSLHVRSKANGLWRMSAPRWTSSNTDCDIYNWRSEETEGGTEGRSGLVFVSHILLIQFIPVIDTFYWTLSAAPTPPLYSTM